MFSELYLNIVTTVSENINYEFLEDIIDYYSYKKLKDKNSGFKNLKCSP